MAPPASGDSGGGFDIDIDPAPDPGDISVDVGGDGGDGGGDPDEPSDPSDVDLDTGFGGGDPAPPPDPSDADPAPPSDPEDTAPSPPPDPEDVQDEPTGGGGDDTRISTPNQPVEDPEPLQGIEDPDTGVWQGIDTTQRAQEFEQRVLEENPQLSEEDVRITPEGEAVLTATGRDVFQQQAQERLDRALTGLGISGVGTGDLRAPEAPRGDFDPTPTDVLDRADVSDPAGGFDETMGGGEGTPPLPELETIGAAGPLGVTVPEARDPLIGEPEADALADVLSEFTTQPDRAPGPGVLVDGGSVEDFQQLQQSFEESLAAGEPDVDRTLTDTRPVVGAAGPLGVTAPQSQLTPGDVSDAATDFFSGLTEPVEGTSGPRDVPEGAPGPGVMISEGGSVDDFRRIRRQLEESLEAGEPDVDVSIDEDAGPVVGAAGPLGVTAPEQQFGAAEARELAESTREFAETAAGRVDVPTSLADLSGEGAEINLEEDAGPVVAAAGPLGVTAPEQQFGLEEARRIAEATEAAAGRLDAPTSFEDFEAGAPPERQPTQRPLFTGGEPDTDTEPVAEGILRDIEETVVTTEEAEGPSPAEIDAMQGVEAAEADRTVIVDGEETTLGEAAQDLEARALEENPSLDPEDIAVRETEGGLETVLTEAAQQRDERFGDFDPVLGGVAVEPTLRRASAGFRDVTAGFAEGATEELGLREGGFADTATESFLTTAPELFNVPGLAVETLEIAEAGAFAAEDPSENVPALVTEADRQIGEGLDYLAKNPAVGVGVGAAVIAQIPTSLATLRGLRAVSPTAARVQDVAWNTPERVLRRTLNLTDEDVSPMAEVRSTRRDVMEALGRRTPGLETRTAAFGGGQGPGQILELRAGGRTLARAEAEPETGGARQRIEEAEGRFSPDPTEAEIETRPEFEFVPTPEIETAIRAEAVTGAAEPELQALQEEEVAFQQQPEPFAFAVPAIDTLARVDVETQTETETDLGLEQELRLEQETRVEQEQRLEQEAELEQEQEMEPETELEFEPETEMEPEVEPNLPDEFEERRPSLDELESDFFEKRFETGVASPEEFLQPDPGIGGDNT